MKKRVFTVIISFLLSGSIIAGLCYSHKSKIDENADTYDEDEVIKKYKDYHFEYISLQQDLRRALKQGDDDRIDALESEISEVNNSCMLYLNKAKEGSWGRKANLSFHLVGGKIHLKYTMR